MRLGRWPARWLLALICLGGAGCQARDAFPPIDRAKLRITLQRSACFGSCPDYKVVVSGDGAVTFTATPRAIDPVAGLFRAHAASTGIVVGGAHRARITPAQVSALIARARAARFFVLKPEYRAEITDNPSYVVTVDTGHGKRTVVDYVGLRAGMPKAEQDFEDAIDRIAGTRRWIAGTAEVIPLLQTEHADFAGPIGAALMTAAAGRNEVATMRRLAGLGAPVGPVATDSPLVAAANAGALAATGFLLDHGAGRNRAELDAALGAAVRANRTAMFRLLVRRTGGRIDDERATRLLPAAAGHGNLEIVTALLAAGADLRGPADRRQYDDPPIFAAAQGSFMPGEDDPLEKRRAVVALLLDRGADIRQCSTACHSILAFVRDQAIARRLIAAGADPNFKDRDGEPVIFSISDEDVALALFAAGARLDSVRPGDRMTLRGWATNQKWPRVLALLAGQGR